MLMGCRLRLTHSIKPKMEREKERQEISTYLLCLYAELLSVRGNYLPSLSSRYPITTHRGGFSVKPCSIGKRPHCSVKTLRIQSKILKLNHLIPIYLNPNKPTEIRFSTVGENFIILTLTEVSLTHGREGLCVQ